MLASLEISPTKINIHPNLENYDLFTTHTNTHLTPLDETRETALRVRLLYFLSNQLGNNDCERGEAKIAVVEVLTLTACKNAAF